MKIGIDMDDTICSTEESIIRYQNIFVKENNINVDDLWDKVDIRNKFLTEYLERIYLDAEIKNNCNIVLNKLKDNNELYIITARTNNYVDDIYKIIKEYLSKNNIIVNGIFINAKDKVDVCIKNNIDIMIEDSYFNFERLKQNNIKTILFDEKEKYPNVETRVSNWNEIEKIFENKRIIK